MTKIKVTTKRGQMLLASAVNYDGFTLAEVYGRYSTAKQNAYDYCKNLCAEENGINFHICSHNTFGFSVAWSTVDGIRIETPKNSYLIYNY